MSRGPRQHIVESGTNETLSFESLVSRETFSRLLCEKVKRSTKDGKPYNSMKFRDLTRTASAPIWRNAPYFSQCDGWNVGQVFKIRGLSEHKQFGPQIEISNIRLATDDDQADGYDPTRSWRRRNSTWMSFGTN